MQLIDAQGEIFSLTGTTQDDGAHAREQFIGMPYLGGFDGRALGCRSGCGQTKPPTQHVTVAFAQNLASCTNRKQQPVKGSPDRPQQDWKNQSDQCNQSDQSDKGNQRLGGKQKPGQCWQRHGRCLEYGLKLREHENRLDGNNQDEQQEFDGDDSVRCSFAQRTTSRLIDTTQKPNCPLAMPAHFAIAQEITDQLHGSLGKARMGKRSPYCRCQRLIRRRVDSGREVLLRNQDVEGIQRRNGFVEQRIQPTGNAGNLATCA